MCMSLIASRCCYVEEPILSRYNGSFEMCSGILLSLYNKEFLDLQLKFVSQTYAPVPPKDLRPDPVWDP